ncbi:hypothetical protein [Propionivibrio sp.]|uniref:hypothetical protein n=1 Tax=Propionivibrio sp. TaxID=2212460 RepID=UPI003BF3000A
MAHYRKIDVGVWNDSAFMSLKPLGKLAFFMLITHPNMTSLGAMRATVPGLASELGVSTKDFVEVFDKGMALVDEKTHCVFVPNFVKYQSAESINVVKSWAKQLQFIPEGILKDKAVASVIAFLEGKALAFRDAFRDAYLVAYPQGKAYPLSTKHLAVSKPLNPPAMIEAVDDREVGGVAKIGAVDLQTGEVTSWAA